MVFLVDTSDPVAFLLSIISSVVHIEKTTFFHFLGMTVSLWDIDIMFGVVKTVIIDIIPTMRNSDETEGSVYARRKL